MSTVRARKTIEPDETYDQYPDLTSIPKNLLMNFSNILDKPYLISSFKWTTAQAQYTNMFYLDLPSAALTNALASIPFNASALYRTKMCIILQVLGTPMHQGMLLASSLPYPGLNVDRYAINSYLQAPHVFLAANESTPVCLEVPFYSNTKLRKCDPNKNMWTPEDFDYATVGIMVMQPLVAPTTGSISLTVSAHVIFKESEFYIPANNTAFLAQSYSTPLTTLVTKVNNIEAQMNRMMKITAIKTALCALGCICSECVKATEFVAQSAKEPVITQIADLVTGAAKSTLGDYIDKARKVFKFYTGFHNPNIPIIEKRVVTTRRNYTNAVDIPTHIEKLDPYANHDRIVSDAVFYTEKDEMLIANIINKPQFLGSFSVTTSTPGNTVVWSRPITPMQERVTSDAPKFSTPLQVFGHMSRFWRGTLKLHIQANMSNFHALKLMVVKNYTADPALLTTPFDPSLFVNLQTETLEFSGGGQIQTIDLPFCSQFDEIPVMFQPSGNALSHGQYFITTVQQLIVNGSVSSSINFNVYISAGDDFNFYGYAVERFINDDSVTPSLMVRDVKAMEKKKEEAKKAEQHKNLLSLIENVAKESDEQKVAIMSPPAEPSQPVLPDPKFKAQASVINNPSDQTDILNSEGHPTFSTRKFSPIVSVRDHMRRFMPSRTYNISGSGATSGIRYLPVNEIIGDIAVQARLCPQKIMRRFFFGQTGGYKLKILISDTAAASVKYLPPQPHMVASNTKWKSSSASYTDADVALQQSRAVAFSHPTALLYPDDGMPFPQIEASGILSGKGAVAATDFTLSSNMSIFEVMIPQMNPCEFVGDITILDTTNQNYFTSDMGTLVISVDNWNPMHFTLTGINTTFTVYVSYADEARLGFNVLAPVVEFEHTNAKITGPYQQPNGAAYTMDYVTAAPQCFVGF
jgi:hypothetical protein